MLKLTDTPCRLGKISNNLEKHGDSDITAFDVPVTVELTGDQLNTLLDDRLFAKRLFDTGGRGRPTRPGDGFEKLKPLELRDSFEDVAIDLLFSGKTAISFEGCKLNKIVLEPCVGGTTECSFSIRLRPNTDKEILQLLHHQRREVEITTSGGKVVVSKRQQDLPLGAEGESGDEGATTPDEASESNGRHAPTANSPVVHG